MDGYENENEDVFFAVYEGCKRFYIYLFFGNFFYQLLTICNSEKN